MAKQFRCRDLGLECDYVACGHTDQEILDKAELHAGKAHGMSWSPQEIYDNGVDPMHEVEYCEISDDLE